MGLPLNEQIASLQLILTPHIGPVSFGHLISYYGSAEQAILHVGELAQRGGQKKPFLLAGVSEAKKQLEQAEREGARILFRMENDYPMLLKEISDAPSVLFIKGNVDALRKKSVALVGTRNASINGKALARKMAYDLAESGYNVVSGMAHGIDRAAHVGALASSQIPATTAVLGTAINEIYPEENRDIYEEIIEKGCLVSEFPYGTPMSPKLFPRRNRIISGLTLGTVVLEAQERSGSLITAKEAASQGREVMAVPGSPIDPRSSGPNKLIKEGASLVSNAQDVMDTLENLQTFSLKEKEPVKAYQQAPLDDNTLKDARSLIWNNLNSDPVSVDDLIRETQLEARIVNIILVELEVAGRLTRIAGNKVSMIYCED